jgi:clostripain
MLPRLCRSLLLAATVATVSAQAPPAPPGVTAERAWTILIYAAIDNDAEHDSNFFSFLDGVRAAYDDDPALELVLFADRSDRFSTNATSLGEDFTDGRLYRVRHGACERLSGGEHFPEVTISGAWEPDSADPVNVKKALVFARARFPARHYGLMLYGHADGRGMCPDEQSEHEMGFAQLTDVVPAELGVDLMALELCNMAGIEIAYQWRPGNGGFATRTLVAIPNAGPPLDWGRVFARVRTAGDASTFAPAKLDGAAFGRLIVDEGGAGRRAAAEREPARAPRLAHEAVTCLDLTVADAVKRAVDALAVRLAAADSKAACAEARGPGARGLVLNYVRDRLQNVPFVDLFDLADRLATPEGLAAKLDEPTRAAARAVADATDTFVLASYGGSGLPRFTAGRNGVFVTFPDGGAIVVGRRGPRPMWSACTFYSPLPVEGVYGRLAWCRDGATAGNGKVENWFELLDSWFDAAGEPGTNDYIH